jgi:hypothetical protein
MLELRTNINRLPSTKAKRVGIFSNTPRIKGKKERKDTGEE